MPGDGIPQGSFRILICAKAAGIKALVLRRIEADLGMRREDTSLGVYSRLRT